MLHVNTAVNTLQMPPVVFPRRLKEKKKNLACTYINMTVYAEIDITIRVMTILRLFGHNCDNEIFNGIINL